MGGNSQCTRYKEEESPQIQCHLWTRSLFGTGGPTKGPNRALLWGRIISQSIIQFICDVSNSFYSLSLSVSLWYPAFTEVMTRFREMVDLDSRQRFSSWNHFKRFFKKQKQTNNNRNKSTSKILEKVRRGERWSENERKEKEFAGRWEDSVTLEQSRRVSEDKAVFQHRSRPIPSTPLNLLLGIFPISSPGLLQASWVEGRELAPGEWPEQP